MKSFKTHGTLLLALCCLQEVARAAQLEERIPDPRMIQQDAPAPEPETSAQPRTGIPQNAQEIPGQGRQPSEEQDSMLQFPARSLPGGMRTPPGQPEVQDMPGEPDRSREPRDMPVEPDRAREPGRTDQPDLPQGGTGRTSIPVSPADPTPPSGFVPAPPPTDPEPEPAAQASPAEPKTAEQKAYESQLLARWSAAADEINRLLAQTNRLQGKKQRAFRESLRTASGNRSIVRTKLNQLSSGSNADWDKRKAMVDRAMADLDAAIARARSHFHQKRSP